MAYIHVVEDPRRMISEFTVIIETKGLKDNNLIPRWTFPSDLVKGEEEKSSIAIHAFKAESWDLTEILLAWTFQ